MAEANAPPEEEAELTHVARKPPEHEEETMVLLKSMGVEEKAHDVTSTVDNLVWEKPELLAPEKQHDVENPVEKPERRTSKTHHKNVSAQMARMMNGSAATVVDTHSNMAHCQEALGHLIVDGTGNSEHGATYLRLLVRPHEPKPHRLDDHDYSHDKGKKPSFGESISEELVSILTNKKPRNRTFEDMVLINKLLGWHPIFNAGQGRVKQRMLRQVECLVVPAHAVVMLQGDEADCAYIVYSGKIAVHALGNHGHDHDHTAPAAKKKDSLKLKEEEKLILTNQCRRASLMRRGVVAKDHQEYIHKAEEQFGPQVATLVPGNCFGEAGLMAPKWDESVLMKRNATINTLQHPVYLFRLSRHSIEIATGRANFDHKEERVALVPGAFRDFTAAPHEELVKALHSEPDQRTHDEAIASISKHCGWLPFLLSTDDEPSVETAYRHLKLFEIPPDTTVCMQRDLAECYFIVYKGECEIYKAKNAQRLNRWKGLHLWVNEQEQEEEQKKDEDIFAYSSSEGHEKDTRKTVKLPLRLLGPKVATLTAGMAFGQNGLDPSPGQHRRSATVVTASGEPTLLLVLYRDDIDGRHVHLDDHALPSPRRGSKLLTVAEQDSFRSRLSEHGQSMRDDLLMNNPFDIDSDDEAPAPAPAPAASVLEAAAPSVRVVDTATDKKEQEAPPAQAMEDEKLEHEADWQHWRRAAFKVVVDRKRHPAHVKPTPPVSPSPSSHHVRGGLQKQSAQDEKIIPGHSGLCEGGRTPRRAQIGRRLQYSQERR